MDKTHVHLFAYKDIVEMLTTNGLLAEKCRFSFVSVFGFQQTNPFPFLPPEVIYFMFNDWHSFVCQYVIKMSASSLPTSELKQKNFATINISEDNAPDYIKNYREWAISELARQLNTPEK